MVGKARGNIIKGGVGKKMTKGVKGMQRGREIE